MLKGKKILLIVTGGIAAYKSALIVRLLVKAGAEVRVVMTADAANFVTPLTLSTLSKNDVYQDFFGSNGSWNNHVELALWADAVLVAPCTANTLGKMVHGICDNLAVAVYLSAKCPVFIAPAMDLDMYAHPSTRQNLAAAEDFGNIIIPAESGELASGLTGEGRLAEPENIIGILRGYFGRTATSLGGKKFLVTAGPTYEAIDPVRFIGNHSSGKMGFALAEAAAERGAEVVLISGPTALSALHRNIILHRVTTAREMFDKVFQFFDDVDVAIASAAVADYRPKETATEKIKKKEDEMTLELVKNPDILRTMGERKAGQKLVGFALETQNEEENAMGKLRSKNLDMIVLNSLRSEGAGFRNDTNHIKILTEKTTREYSLKPKKGVAADILDFLENEILNS
ncbi:bifunctional phosphopantothenoylcysteine decarboxylase/phosphopantothenate--cysteine ligase CoaBC [Cruoricaptor ignavus]|uniref:Coenzyme A biosynthesis bifunctional protein CoaBC n=1 Tax=Cruoricaptor ignavus TaxID=1118202 RepID=A0A7M1T6Z9_9FLAO|nr:bifunctional phosphopantothenoylcysteine decarboxylase/phosphopantothenate--cysteine ligase CoaBC [Cruoricaptor ignavus]QOR74874.1 bifunctional phosphopantothenoylcysteine decarboxylase/phosphopantothenate--cysteine ligase CoaBC [Cruoricaptor ignavus]